MRASPSRFPMRFSFVPGVAIGRTGPEGGIASIFLNGGNSSLHKSAGGRHARQRTRQRRGFFQLHAGQRGQSRSRARRGKRHLRHRRRLWRHSGLHPSRHHADSAKSVIFAEGGASLPDAAAPKSAACSAASIIPPLLRIFPPTARRTEQRFLNRTLSGNFGYRFGEDNQLRLIAAQQHQQRADTRPNPA